MSAFSSVIAGSSPEYQPNPVTPTDPLSQIIGAVQTGVGKIFNTNSAVPAYGTPPGIQENSSTNFTSLALIGLLVIVLIGSFVFLTKK